MIASPKKTLSFTIEKTIAASPKRAFDAWLNPKVSGTVWNAADKYILNAKEDGLFYWLLMGTAHYGRFTEVKRGQRLKHTWMSPNTGGEETNVVVTFKKQGDGTLMTLVHSDLPDTKASKGHLNGWNYFMGTFLEQFGDGTRRKFNFDDAKGKKSKK